VKKLKEKSKSAGNILQINETSETLRNEVVIGLEHVKKISLHVPKHSRPLNDEQLGHYIAGLIDGDGHFSSIQQLVIVFSSPDAFLAYYLKKRLGYGNVKKVKDKNAYILVVSNKQGMLNILNLVNGKLRSEHRFNQVINNVLKNTTYSSLGLEFTLNSSNNFDNHWLAGFSDADASFQVNIVTHLKRSKREVRLNYQIDQNKKLLLENIKNYLGGNIGYREGQDTYYYGSTSFGCAKNVIRYFDKFNLQSKKYVSYLRWRKVYVLIQNKQHLAEKGLAKIVKVKPLINRH